MKSVAGEVAHFWGLASKASVTTWLSFTKRGLRLHEELLSSGVSRKRATGETFLLSSQSRGRDSSTSVAGGPRRKRTSVVLKWLRLETEVCQVLKKPREVQNPSCSKLQQSDGWFAAPCPLSTEPSNRRFLFAHKLYGSLDSNRCLVQEVMQLFLHQPHK